MKFPLLTIVIAGIVVALIVPAMNDRKKAEVEDSAITAVMVEAKAETKASEETSEVSETTEKIVEETEEVFIPDYDFESLKSENQDVCAWIEIPGTEVNYPVMYDGTDDYLNKSLQGEDSTAGSIYIDPLSHGLNNPVNIIYGHNMRNGSRFAAVNKFNTVAYFDKHQEVRISMEDRNLALKPFLSVIGPADGSVRNINSVDELKTFCSTKQITNGTYEYEGNLYVLITCNYSGDNYRTYLFCKAE